MGKRLDVGKKQHSQRKPLLLVLIVLLCALAVAAAVWKWGGNTAPEDDATKAPVDTSSDGTQDVLETPATQSGTEKPPVVIADKKQATYEEWLAAGMVVAISMEYPEFELKEIDLTGETALPDKQTSSGVYVVFVAEGTEQAVHGFSLEAERTEKGTVDLYTKELGFSAFDLTDPESIDTAACRQVEIGDLDELIGQSLLVSLYEH